MSEDDVLQIVRMGELKVAGRNDVLKATLGSCVGIAFLWRGRGRYGLAHCLLDEDPRRGMSITARYVDRAIPSLLRVMGIRKDNYSEIEVVIADGARMFGDSHERKHVGKLNADTAKRCLREVGLTVSRSETGGKLGRQMILDCRGPDVTIALLAPQPMEMHDEHQHPGASR